MKDQRKRDRAGRVIPDSVSYSDDPARIAIDATNVRVTRNRVPDAHDSRPAAERRSIRPYSRRRLASDIAPSDPRVTAIGPERVAEVFEQYPDATVRVVRKGSKYRADMLTYRVDPSTL